MVECGGLEILKGVFGLIFLLCPPLGLTFPVSSLSEFRFTICRDTTGLSETDFSPRGYEFGLQILSSHARFARHTNILQIPAAQISP